ncbi:phosphatase PAP2 family protein [Bradyrhizobium sp. AUGA SZCCT0274]|uniref:phosphatase PAP2 family protein n=1 Tax=Bradyrhizobium sp. AUGA SZCCT0274 TaxID=2807670 RepID=UPI001BA5E088|nr:phosphatase PAP2 family protein [Bradyrhizobium sp. AUGA SZCCT0274]MBR1245110.1 phosphatase PAP2 family protein [Bradyrhizobium sp. AUGA SZCCT0274]
MAADTAIGFDWLSFFNWVKARPAIDLTFAIAYDSAIVQIAVLLVVLNVTGRLDRAREFIWLLVLTIFITVPLSGIFPAECPWSYFGVEDRVDAYHLADFTALRSGQMPQISLANAKGLITFPSFHASLGLIWPMPAGVFPIFVVLNAVMISALTSGGHYLVDIIAGLAIVPAAVLWLTRLRLMTR